MDREKIAARLGSGSLFAGRLTVTGEVSSTNTCLKELAAKGAPEGTALIALRQTGGRGTGDRSFFSPEGGVYLSVLLRSEAPLQDLLTLTGRTASAVRRGVAEASGAPAEIKWLNDLWLEGKKLCGILAELGPIRPDGTAEYVVLGVGVNANQSAEDFEAAGLGKIAVSLRMAGYPTERETLCASILRALEEMYRDFPGRGAEYLADYRVHCCTPGRRVEFRSGGANLTGLALGINEDYSLRVLGEDGSEREVTAGQVRLL